MLKTNCIIAKNSTTNCKTYWVIHLNKTTKIKLKFWKNTDNIISAKSNQSIQMLIKLNIKLLSLFHNIQCELTKIFVTGVHWKNKIDQDRIDGAIVAENVQRFWQQDVYMINDSFIPFLKLALRISEKRF